MSVSRISFDSNNEVGVFSRLTNAYCIIGVENGERSTSTLKRPELPPNNPDVDTTVKTWSSIDRAVDAPDIDPNVSTYGIVCRLHNNTFYSTLEGELVNNIPIVNTTVAGCRIVGRMCVGNKSGLILPSATYDTELQHIKNALPDNIKIRTVEERLSALGNVIACNDNIALVHPDLDKDTEDIISDVLQVEVIRHTIANNLLVGANCVLTNNGALVNPDTSVEEQEELSSILQLPLAVGTVNSGRKTVGEGIIANDWSVFCGAITTSTELNVIESIFKLEETIQSRTTIRHFILKYRRNFHS